MTSNSSSSNLFILFIYIDEKEGNSWLNRCNFEGNMEPPKTISLINCILQFPICEAVWTSDAEIIKRRI